MVRFPVFYFRPRCAAVAAAVLVFAALLCFRRSVPRPAPVAAPAAQPAGTEETAAPSAAARTLPVLMYHSVCDHPTLSSVYILSPAAFAEDLRYLKAHGYEAVFLRDVLAFAAGEGTLPAKPVVLTFDDGCLNNLTDVLPLLREAGMRAEINIVGEYTDRAAAERYRSPKYSYLTWAEVRALQESGCFEIGCHTYAMHALSPRRGCDRRAGETDDAYRAVLTEDVAAMREAMRREKTPATVIFAYPFGAVGDGAQEILESLGFTVFLTCSERLNTVARGVPLPPLGRINRTSALSTEEFMRKNGIR